MIVSLPLPDSDSQPPALTLLHRFLSPGAPTPAPQSPAPAALTSRKSEIGLRRGIPALSHRQHDGAVGKGAVVTQGWRGRVLGSRMEGTENRPHTGLGYRAEAGRVRGREPADMDNSRNDADRHEGAHALRVHLEPVQEQGSHATPFKDRDGHTHTHAHHTRGKTVSSGCQRHLRPPSSQSRWGSRRHSLAPR